MIYDKHNETHDKYVQAMKSLDAHNAVSEYRKVPETPEETAFMQETNQARTSSCFGFSNIDDGRWSAIWTVDTLANMYGQAVIFGEDSFYA